VSTLDRSMNEVTVPANQNRLFLSFFIYLNKQLVLCRIFVCGSNQNLSSYHQRHVTDIHQVDNMLFLQPIYSPLHFHPTLSSIPFYPFPSPSTSILPLPPFPIPHPFLSISTYPISILQNQPCHTSVASNKILRSLATTTLTSNK
jgi:hypothetical protein